MLSLLLALVPAAAPPTWPLQADLDVVELARLVKPSVVVVHQQGRGGSGLGSGFVLSPDGLIATNQHVIGEGRGLVVELADGTRHDVTEVFAFDRKNDLAVIRIAAKNLPPLALGDAAALRDGQPVVAIGNPRGLKSSVVAGVVSGRRDVDGRSMIQVAIPVEQGNSGGPLVDRRGRVVGVLTLKSLVTDNLGFAMPANALRPLLLRPSPVPMSAWRTIGVLDREEWTLRGGAQWRQRAGRILVEGAGAGFGGRSLCLSRREVPAVPFEVGVQVKLDDERGAAGLVFHADGGDRHYGFYPSGGRLRFVRFAGADVFSWTVVGEKASPAYRPGEWNALRVRLEKGRIRCWVNDAEVFDVEDDTFTSGSVGLAKFRDTVAEFKLFRVAKSLPPTSPSAELMARLTKATAGLSATGPVPSGLVEKMPDGKPVTLAALREQARLLERRAEQLRKLAAALHVRETLGELEKVLRAKEIDLIHAALLIARLDNDDLDVEAYRGEVDRMARRVSAGLKAGAGDTEKLAALERYLFREKGYHGSRGDYYNRSNSYLSEVIDDREGLPITLSLLYLELARRLGVKVEGVGLPGHFVVRHVPRKAAAVLIDVYDGGKRMTRAEAAQKVQEIAGRELTDDDLTAVTPRQLLTRVLYNLLGVARTERDVPGMLRYADALLTIDPKGADERGLRASLRFQAGDIDGAKADVDWLLENRPAGIDLERVEQLKRFLERQRKE